MLVLTTGGSSGIRKGLATEFLARGDHVVSVADGRGRLQQDVRDLEKIQPHIDALPCDVGYAAQVREMAERVLAQYGCPDVLVKNVGFSEYRTFEDASIEYVERIVDVKFLGAVRCTKEFLRPMIVRGRGVIVNMASIAGIVPLTPDGMYSASKHAMVAWSENLRLELNRFGIYVTTICPGKVATNFHNHKTFRNRAQGFETRPSVSIHAVCRATVRAIEHHKSLVFVPERLRLCVWQSKALPFLIEPVVDRMIRSRVESYYAHRAVASIHGRQPTDELASAERPGHGLESPA